MSLSLLHVDDETAVTLSGTRPTNSREILRAMVADERVVVVVHAAAATRTRFLDELTPGLQLDGFRVVRVASERDAPLTMRSIMDQVIGADRHDGADRVQEVYAALTRPLAVETRLALVIDDAHLLTEQALGYLDLLASTARVTPLPLQLLLAGTMQLWDRLPASGSLATEGIATRIVLGDKGARPMQGPRAALPATDRPPFAEAASHAQIEHRPTLARRRPTAWIAGLVVLAVSGGLGAVWFLEEPFQSGPRDPRPALAVVPRVPGPAAERRAADASRPIAAIVPAAVAEPAPAETKPADPKPSEPAASVVAAASAASAPADGTALGPSTTEAEAVPPELQAATPATEPQAATPATEPQAVVPPAPQVEASMAEAQPIAPGIVPVLLARGDALLATGDIVAARLMYARAASSSGAAAIAMGMTYDPRFLAEIGAQGMVPDAQRAVAWYRRAAELGSAEATPLLARLDAGGGH